MACRQGMYSSSCKWHFRRKVPEPDFERITDLMRESKVRRLVINALVLRLVKSQRAEPAIPHNCWGLFAELRYAINRTASHPLAIHPLLFLLCIRRLVISVSFESSVTVIVGKWLWHIKNIRPLYFAIIHWQEWFSCHVCWSLVGVVRWLFLFCMSADNNNNRDIIIFAWGLSLVINIVYVRGNRITSTSLLKTN